MFVLTFFLLSFLLFFFGSYFIFFKQFLAISHLFMSQVWLFPSRLVPFIMSGIIYLWSFWFSMKTFSILQCLFLTSIKGTHDKLWNQTWKMLSWMIWSYPELYQTVPFERVYSSHIPDTLILSTKTQGCTQCKQTACLCSAYSTNLSVNPFQYIKTVRFFNPKHIFPGQCHCTPILSHFDWFYSKKTNNKKPWKSVAIHKYGVKTLNLGKQRWGKINF